MNIPRCPCCGSDVTEAPRPLISIENNKMLASGEIIKLSPRQTEIMSILIDAMPLPIDHERIIARLYGAMPVDDAANTLKVFVCQLRKKIKPTNLQIRTVWGRGFALEYKAAA